MKAAYFEGQPPKSVNMYWRRFALSSIPIDDPVAFEVWLRARWMEKDGLIEAYYRHGRFPADRGAHKTPEGRIVRGAGHIETEIKSNYWYEFLQIFAPVGLLALVLYTFYNALPDVYAKSLSGQDMVKQAGDVQKTQINLQKQRLLPDPVTKSPTNQDSVLGRAMTVYTGLSKNPAVRKVVQLPELTQKGLKNEMIKHQPAVDTILTQKNALQDLKIKLPAVRPSSQAPDQVIKQPHIGSHVGSQTMVSRRKPGSSNVGKPVQKRAPVLSPNSQNQTSGASVVAKSPGTAALPQPATKQVTKQPGTPRPPVNRPQLQSMSAPKLHSKPKPTKLKPATATNSFTK